MTGDVPASIKCISYTPWLLVVLALTSLPVSSQTQVATVFGTVTDPRGAVIPGAQVTISSQSTGLKRTAVTDTTGQYRFAGLPAGSYDLRTEKQGFKAEVRGGITIHAASDVAIDVSLSIRGQSEQVSVTASITGIDTATSTVGGLVAEQGLAELPLNGRDLFNAVILEPGVASTPSSAPSLLSSGQADQVSIDGTRPTFTNVLMDGMDATDPVFGFSPAGASGFFLGLNELAEVRVLTQTFEPEYSGHGGAVIELTTRSGTNQFHGSLGELYRGASFDAKNYFDLGSNPIPPFVRNQFGAGLGGPLAHNRTFFFANFEGFRQVQATTAIATVPDALAHQGLLPSASDRSACSSATPSGCVAVPVDHRIQQFLNLIPPSNGADNGNGTGDLITADKSVTRDDHGMVRVDHSFSNTHSIFARYTIDDSSSEVPYVGQPPGTFTPGFPSLHSARNQYFGVQDRMTFGPNVINEFRFGINRTTASTSIVNTHPGLSISLLSGQPLGMLGVAGMSLIGNSPIFPLGDFSTVYQVQDQLSRTIGRHTLKVGTELRRIQSNGPLDFGVNGLYTFQDLTPFGLRASSNNPAIEFFLEALPLSYVGTDPSNSDSDRGYRQSVASGFVQDYFRATSRLIVNVGLRYDFYSNPTEANGHLSAIRNPATDSGPTVGHVFASTPLDLWSPQAGLSWNIFGDGKTLLRSGFGIYRDNLPEIFFGVDRALPPFYSLRSYVLPEFLNPRKDLVTQQLYVYQGTYHPQFPYALQYNLNLERDVARGTIVKAGYFGARGNHLPREMENNPFEPALGHRYNPNLPSPLLEDLTDAQSFYNALQLSVTKQTAHGLSWQAFYTYAHSIDDASNDESVDAVNEPPTTQNPFNRKGDRGSSGFDIRHDFVASVIYELPLGRGPILGGWQVSAVANVHSGLPFTPVLPFDNADLQSLLTSERPDLVGNPHTGVCPNGSRVGTPSCWFNPGAFAVPAPGQFGNAGRNILRGPGFAQFDLSLKKSFQLKERAKVTLGAEAYNLFNHPNFSVPSNSQNPFSLGGNGDAVFASPAGNFSENAGRIFTTVGTGRQIQLDARLTF